MWVQTPWGVFEVRNSFFMYNTIFVYILRVPVSMKGSKGHQKSRKQRKQTGFKELAHIWGLCSAIASPSLLSSSPIWVNPRGRAWRYRKRGSPRPAAGDAGAMDTNPRPVRLWDSEGHSEGYRTAYEQPLESEETARPPTRANTAPGPSLEHDAEGLERPARARTAPVAQHTEPTRDSMGDTLMAEESEAPGTAGCAGSGGKHAECHCEHVSFLMGKYPIWAWAPSCIASTA